MTACSNSGTMAPSPNQPSSPPRGPTAGRLLLRQLGEVRAAFEFLDDGLRLFLGLDQDVRGVELDRRIQRAISLVISSLQGFVADVASQGALDHFLRQDGAALVLKAQFQLRRDLGQFLGQQVLVDQLIDDSREQGLVWQLLVLRGQLAAHGDDVAQRDLGVADAGDDGIGAVLGGGGILGVSLFRRLLILGQTGWSPAPARRRRSP